MKSWLRWLAVANLCLIRIWVELLAYPEWPFNRDYAPPDGSHYLAAVALCVILSVIFWLAFYKAGFKLRILMAAVIILLISKELFMALSSLGLFERSNIAAIIPWFPVLIPAAVAACVYGLRRLNRPNLERWTEGSATALIPLIGLTFGQSAWIMRNPPPANPGNGRHINAATDYVAKKRVVWMVVDELDERVAFSERRGDFKLPELDRFRKEASFVALQAKSPSNETALSIPSMFNGQPAKEFHKLHRTIFHELREKNLRTALVGWYIPYCPQIGAVLEVCEWWPYARQHNSYGEGFLNIVRGNAISLVESHQLSPFGQTLTNRKHAQQVAELMHVATAAASRADLDFVFLHLPHPHSPFIFDPKSGTPTAVPHPPDAPGYYRNLQWADSAFSTIRCEMEKAGLWDRSIVLVTGDHGFRDAAKLGYEMRDRHVPFMLKTNTALQADPKAPFETLHTAALLKDLLTRAEPVP
jgi:hypothetical protein